MKNGCINFMSQNSRNKILKDKTLSFLFKENELKNIIKSNKLIFDFKLLHFDEKTFENIVLPMCKENNFTYNCFELTYNNKNESNSFIMYSTNKGNINISRNLDACNIATGKYLPYKNYVFEDNDDNSEYSKIYNFIKTEFSINKGISDISIKC